MAKDKVPDLNHRICFLSWFLNMYLLYVKIFSSLQLFWQHSTLCQYSITNLLASGMTLKNTSVPRAISRRLKEVFVLKNAQIETENVCHMLLQASSLSLSKCAFYPLITKQIISPLNTEQIISHYFIKRVLFHRTFYRKNPSLCS